MNSCCALMSGCAATCSTSWTRRATRAGGRKSIPARQRSFPSISGQLPGQYPHAGRPNSRAKILSTERHGANRARRNPKGDCNDLCSFVSAVVNTFRELPHERPLQFSQLLKLLAAPGALLEHVPPGALQVFRGMELAAGVGALNFGQIGGKFRVPVLK